jgi:hypothetical protein
MLHLQLGNIERGGLITENNKTINNQKTNRYDIHIL